MTMSGFPALIDAIAGSPRTHVLEERLFNTVSLLNGIANLGGAAWSLRMSHPGQVVILHAVFGIAFLACFALSRRRNWWRPLFWPFTALMLVFVWINALQNAGTLGGAHYYLIPATVIAVVLAPHAKDRFLAVLLALAATAALAGVEILRPGWIDPYATPAERWQDVPGNLLFVELFTAAVVIVLARNLNQERAQSDRLLLSILPAAVAGELKRTDRVTPREYASASVLFTDFVGFTHSAEHLTPAQLVGALDSAFAEFDRCIRLHGLEKIKTIGDAYMAVGGIPDPSDSHAIDCVRAALDIRDAMRAGIAEGRLPPWRVRIGVHTGPLIAGVVGRDKFAYDVWGDTVNTASRMESSGEPDRVNVSLVTWERVRHAFAGTPRGPVAAKNKGAIEMVFVERLSS
jgi:adenylate cyclase